VPLNRGTNCSVIGAFSLSGMVASDSVLGAVRRTRFESFLRHHVLPAVLPGTVLILDNARIHHGGQIEEIVRSFGCSLLYLPPYSPDLSPIELAWSYVKHLVRASAPREDQAREEAIESAICRISARQARAWFRKCGHQS
jgi:transposase